MKPGRGTHPVLTHIINLAGTIPLWIQILATVIGATAVIVSLIMWLERRASRRQESWLCPDCGSAFGPQLQQRIWAIRSDPHVMGLPASGPILTCPHCHRDFAFDGKGRQVDDSVVKPGVHL